VTLILTGLTPQQTTAIHTMNIVLNRPGGISVSELLQELLNFSERTGAMLYFGCDINFASFLRE